MIETQYGNEEYPYEFLRKLKDMGLPLQRILNQGADQAVSNLVKIAITFDPVIDPEPMTIQDYMRSITRLAIDLSEKEGFFHAYRGETDNLDVESLTKNAAFLFRR